MDISITDWVAAGSETRVERQVNSWRLFRPGLQRPLRSLLGELCPRSHLWTDPVHDEGAHRQGDPGKRLLSGQAHRELCDVGSVEPPRIAPDNQPNRLWVKRKINRRVSLQVKEIIDCVHADTRVELPQLLVDGGMAKNEALMQLQANILGVNVVRPQMLETTALGAALAAGIAKGVDVWSLAEMQKGASAVSDTFEPQIVQ